MLLLMIVSDVVIVLFEGGAFSGCASVVSSSF